MIESKSVPILEVKNISKKFGNFYANKNISFSIQKGEIYAILGENGAGKSTLISSLYGVFKPTEGEIFLDGVKVDIHNPKVAIKHGIGMVFQHFKLIEDFTVAENIMLGSEFSRFGFLDKKRAQKEISKLIEKYNFQIDINEKIANLSVGSQQKVEILKILYRGANLLILDEPTAVLTPQEIDELVFILKTLQEQGKTLIIITHKLKEVRQLSKKCTIIRAGEAVGTFNLDETDNDYIANKMIGRSLIKNFEKAEFKDTNGSKLLEIKNLFVQNERGIDTVSNLSLSVKEKEIFGIAGVDGNGQKELVEALIGIRKVNSGKIYFNGKDITNLGVRKTFEEKMTCIPEDRQSSGLVLDFTMSENMILRRYYEKNFQKNGIIAFDKVLEYTKKNIEDFDIRPKEPNYKMRNISGGNQQKVIISRELSSPFNLVVASQPTRGLDIGAIEYVHKALMKQRNEGKSILLISFELDEIMTLADRIAVIYKGRIVTVVDTKDANVNRLGLMMTGALE